MKTEAEEELKSKDNKNKKRAKKASLAPTIAPAPPIQTYSKLKVNQLEFAQGDSVMLLEYSNKEAIAHINSIFKD